MIGSRIDKERGHILAILSNVTRSVTRSRSITSERNGKDVAVVCSEVNGDAVTSEVVRCYSGSNITLAVISGVPVVAERHRRLLVSVSDNGRFG